MLKNYCKVAWRNLLRNKGYSAINIIGLSVGMAVAMIIGLWIWDEFSFDTYNPQYKRIAQVEQTVNNNGELGVWNNVPFPMGEELRKSYGSSFKYVVMSTWTGDHILTFGEKKLMKKGNYFGPQAPWLLDLKMLKGNRDGLKDPNSLFLSRSVAKAYFGEADPMGKILTIDNRLPVKVTGVYEDLPMNSSFSELGFIAPWELLVISNGLNTRDNPWRSNSYKAYVQLADNEDMEKVSEKIKDAKLRKVRQEELIHHAQLFLHPMSKWHLYSDFRNGVNVGGRIQYVWMFGIIGLFVLLLACINFMNLSTARSEKRAKEVGIRKAIGSLRGQLIKQFFSESLLVALLAFLFSLLLVQLILPFFNQVADKKMFLPWSNPLFWLLGLGFTILTGLIAGSYPALYLSSFKPVKVLKGTFKAGRMAAIPRKALVVLQFTVSVVLIVGTIIVFTQIQYARNRPIGYSRDGLIMVPMSTSEIHGHFDAVKNELRQKGAISEMAESGSPVTGVWSTNSGFDWKGKDPGLAVDFPNTEVSYDYGPAVGWQFLEGRGFSRDYATDSSAFVINETAAKYMGLKNPVGEVVRWDDRPYTVIGVIRDMIVESPYEAVRPSVFHISKDPCDLIFLKINPAISAGKALAEIGATFTKYNPAQPFDYLFADAEYAKKFGAEERIGKLAFFFAALAIFISCLGLFALASFVAEQRTKEIGVRKVLGATIVNLWSLLSKEFVWLVSISLLIAIPLSWYGMHNWLGNYQYHTKISWLVFASAGIGALLITLLTVSFQAIRAALMNPVKSLRSE